MVCIHPYIGYALTVQGFILSPDKDFEYFVEFTSAFDKTTADILIDAYKFIRKLMAHYPNNFCDNVPILDALYAFIVYRFAEASCNPD